MQLERVISIMRYCPAKGTAGLARSRVSGKSRSPATAGEQDTERISHDAGSSGKLVMRGRACDLGIKQRSKAA